MPTILLAGKPKASLLVGLLARFGQTPPPMPRQLSLGFGDAERPQVTSPMKGRGVELIVPHNPCLHRCHIDGR